MSWNNRRKNRTHDAHKHICEIQYINIERYRSVSTSPSHHKYLYMIAVEMGKFSCNLWIDRTYFVRMEIYIRHSVSSCRFFNVLPRRISLCFSLSSAFHYLKVVADVDLTLTIFYLVILVCSAASTDVEWQRFSISLSLSLSHSLMRSFAFFLFRSHFIYVRYYLLFALNASATLCLPESKVKRTNSINYTNTHK